MINEHYISRERRDTRYRELIAAGHRVRRRSSRNQQIHPEYIEDYEGTYQTGFGNTDYKTCFAVLYGIESRRA